LSGFILYASFVYFATHTIGRTQYEFVVSLNLKKDKLPESDYVKITDTITHVKSARGGVRK
jgi:hypothetical protein